MESLIKSLKTKSLRTLQTVVAVAAITTLVTACGAQAAASAQNAGASTATAAAVDAILAREQRIQLAEDAVRNGKYELPGIGSFQLRDGNYQEKYGEGATQVKRVGVSTVAFGDLDGDKVEDAAVVLWANTGGSGTFMYLAPVLNRDGKGQQAGAQLLGDRVQIQSLAVESGMISVSVLTQGTGDSMVSPSLQSVREFGVHDGRLVNLTPATPPASPAPAPTRQPAAQPTPRPSQPTPVTAPRPTVRPERPLESGITNTIWIWQRFVDNGEQNSFLLPYPAAYRLELLADGKARIQADCNTGSGSYTLAGSRLDLEPGAMTKVACRQGSRSDQFVEMLGQVATYVLEGENLHLNLKADAGDLVFGKLYSVTGTIVGPEGVTPPEGSSAEIMIVDAAGARIGGSLVKAGLPMSFEAPFKPANIAAASAYTLEVTIRDAQKNVIFSNARPYPVLTQGNPTYHLEVAVERAR